MSVQESAVRNQEAGATSLSRIGKLPIVVPNGVAVTLEAMEALVKGPKGELRVPLFTDVTVQLRDTTLVLEPQNPSAQTKARHGLLRSLLHNAVVGVSEGFVKELEIQGVGYRVSLAGKALKLHLGFSHELTFAIPEGIEIAVDGLKLTISGHDKYLVGQTAANIRKLKKPEPYKGKGIRYADEYVIRKSGKTAA